jgi:hypothetical protein
MLFSRVQSACKKHGITITGDGYRHAATKGDRRLEFFQNGRDSGVVLYFTLRHPETNASVDLFMDTYINTLKGAIQYLNGEGYR